MLCPDIPNELVNCAVLSIDPIEGYSNPVRYHHQNLCVAVFVTYKLLPNSNPFSGSEQDNVK